MMSAAGGHRDLVTVVGSLLSASAGEWLAAGRSVGPGSTTRTPTESHSAQDRAAHHGGGNSEASGLRNGQGDRPGVRQEDVGKIWAGHPFRDRAPLRGTRNGGRHRTPAPARASAGAGRSRCARSTGPSARGGAGHKGRNCPSAHHRVRFAHAGPCAGNRRPEQFTSKTLLFRILAPDCLDGFLLAEPLRARRAFRIGEVPRRFFHRPRPGSRDRS